MNNTITVSMQDLDDHWVDTYTIEVIHRDTGLPFNSTRRIAMSGLSVFLSHNQVFEIFDKATFNTHRQQVLLACAMARHVLPALKDTTTYHRYQMALYTALKYAGSEMPALEYDRKVNDFITSVMPPSMKKAQRIIVHARAAIVAAVQGMTAETEDNVYGVPIAEDQDSGDDLNRRHQRYIDALFGQGVAALERVMEEEDNE